MSRILVTELTDLDTDQGRAWLLESLRALERRLNAVGDEVSAVSAAQASSSAAAVAQFPVAQGELPEHVPVGAIVQRHSAVVPPNWLECNGASFSAVTYPELNAVLGGTTLPDFRGRAPIGVGTGAGLTARALGATPGAEAHALSEAEHRRHSHSIAHVHDVEDHDHDVAYQYGGAGGANPFPDILGTGASQVTVATKATTAAGVLNTTAQDTNSSGDWGGGAAPPAADAHNNMQPSLAVHFLIRAKSETQRIGVSWGPVAAQWELDTPRALPGGSVTNQAGAVGALPQHEAWIKASFAGGTIAGSCDDCVLRGVYRLPEGFNAWSPDGVRLRARVEATGAGGGTSITVTLRVYDPADAATVLATTARTVNVSAGSISDGAFVWSQVDAGQLGAGWSAGSLVLFELEIEAPQTFTTLDLYVGLLELNFA